MNKQKIDFGKIVGVLMVASVLVFDVWIYFFTGQNSAFKAGCLFFSLIVLGLAAALNRAYRKQVLDLADTVCRSVDQLSGGEIPAADPQEDTLISKIQMKLDKLSDITYAAVSRQTHQKEEVQQMVSDISHQLKTPIANITMYSAMLDNDSFTSGQKQEFLKVIQSQVEKMEFLVEALAKMSRLESHLIHLEIRSAKIYETLFQAVSQVSSSAEKKQISLSIECDEALLLPHDARWTAEAIFNILDNAVKYTPANGLVSVCVEPWELFTKIDIQDNGIGISLEHYEDIFKRFYREGKVHQTEGFGIGLYLSREIITQQGGYIKVKSKENEGTVFSVFLPNE